MLELHGTGLLFNLAFIATGPTRVKLNLVERLLDLAEENRWSVAASDRCARIFQIRLLHQFGPLLRGCLLLHESV